MTMAKATSQSEGRPRPERNLDEAAGDRTQGRGSLPAKLVQVNEAARRSRQTCFTAVLHHDDDDRPHDGRHAFTSTRTVSGAFQR